MIERPALRSHAVLPCGVCLYPPLSVAA
jgi:hypothetical protein